MKGFGYTILLAAAVGLNTVSNGIKVNYVPMFDFDGNLLTTASTVKLEHYENGVWVPRNLTTSEWAAVSERNDTSYRASQLMDMYWDYSDKDGDDAFERMALQAAENKSNFGPAYPFWRQHILRGIPYAMITARAHDPVNMKRGMEALMRRVFTAQEQHAIVKGFLSETAPIFDYDNKDGWWKKFFADENNVWNTYMRGCQFFPVSNEWLDARSECESSAACKAKTVSDLVANTLPYRTRGEQPQVTVMSFFDDEHPNLKAVREIMENELAVRHPEICFRIYDTSDLKAPAKQIDINAACKNIPAGDDWQSQFFLSNYKGGVRVFAFKSKL